MPRANRKYERMGKLVKLGGKCIICDYGPGIVFDFSGDVAIELSNLRIRSGGSELYCRWCLSELFGGRPLGSRNKRKKWADGSRDNLRTMLTRGQRNTIVAQFKGTCERCGVVYRAEEDYRKLRILVCLARGPDRIPIRVRSITRKEKDGLDLTFDYTCVCIRCDIEIRGIKMGRPMRDKVAEKEDLKRGLLLSKAKEFRRRGREINFLNSEVNVEVEDKVGEVGSSSSYNDEGFRVDDELEAMGVDIGELRKKLDIEMEG